MTQRAVGRESLSLSDSYRYCEQLARTQARNFYYSFVVLPRQKRAAMCAIYAFMRYSDDISDSEEETKQRAANLREWRVALDRALAGEYAGSPILPAFHDVVSQYHVPNHLFYELIDGAEMDLQKTRYKTFEELRQYCYRVAGVVGLVCIHIWGFDGSAEALAHAEACGLAFQLTNILRDLKEDAARDRIYLPQEDLFRFGYSESDLRAEVVDARFVALMQFELERAEAYYTQALKLLPMLHPAGRATYQIMYSIYHGLLQEIKHADYNVFAHRARLSPLRKAAIVGRTWFASRTNHTSSRAGTPGT